MKDFTDIKRMIASALGCSFGFCGVLESDQDMDAGSLYPEEKALLSEKAVKKRVVDFSLGRFAARNALKQLGIENFPVLKGQKNEPIWPKGIVGSISHTNGIAVAVTALNTQVDGVGIDIEKISESLSVETYSKICHDEELEWVMEDESHRLERIISIFSSKESIFKCLFPEVGKYFDFKDAFLAWDKETSSFNGRLSNSLSSKYGEGYKFNVSVVREGDYVLSFMKTS